MITGRREKQNFPEAIKIASALLNVYLLDWQVNTFLIGVYPILRELEESVVFLKLSHFKVKRWHSS